jgi:hypothetical protein
VPEHFKGMLHSSGASGKLQDESGTSCGSANKKVLRSDGDIWKGHRKGLECVFKN